MVHEVSNVKHFRINPGVIGGDDRNDIRIFWVRTRDNRKSKGQILHETRHRADMSLAANNATWRNDMPGTGNTAVGGLESSNAAKMGGDANAARGVAAQIKRGSADRQNGRGA